MAMDVHGHVARRSSPPEGFLDEARSFIRTNWLVMAAAAAVMLLAYGFGLTTYSLSIDEELRLISDGTAVWLEQGRPVLALVELLLLDTVPLSFFDLGLSLALLLVAAAMWAILFTHAAGRQFHAAALLVFLIVFTTLPTNAYQLMFDIMNVEVSLGIIFAAASAWLAWKWAIEDGGPSMAISATVLAALAVGTYQSLAFVLIAGVLIAQLAHLVAGDGAREALPTRHALGRSVRLVAPAVIALAIGVAINYVLVARGGYTESNYIAWGNDDVFRIVGRFGLQLFRYAAGRAFVGGWLLMPSIVAGLVVLALLVRDGRSRGRWYPVFLLVAIGFTPFAMSVVLGTPLPVRAMQALTLVAASMWLLMALMLPAKRALTAVLLTSALLLAVWNAGITTRLFVTEYQTYENDRTIATQIVERLARAGWDGQNIAIVPVGSRVLGPVEGMAADNTFGGSFFNWGGGLRADDFMTVLGYPIDTATEQQRQDGLVRAVSMPAWPAEGSLVLEDGFFVVKFAEPEAESVFETVIE
jgi:Glucosyl transferase GtrII